MVRPRLPLSSRPKISTAPGLWEQNQRSLYFLFDLLFRTRSLFCSVGKSDLLQRRIYCLWILDTDIVTFPSDWDLQFIGQLLHWRFSRHCFIWGISYRLCSAGLRFPPPHIGKLKAQHICKICLAVVEQQVGLTIFCVKQTNVYKSFIGYKGVPL